MKEMAVSTKMTTHCDKCPDESMQSNMETQERERPTPLGGKHFVNRHAVIQALLFHL